MHLGRWWLPENPRRRIFGLLDAPPDDDITLSLAGMLARPNGSATILGRTRDGESVTLLDCLCTSSRVSFTTGPGRSEDRSREEYFAHTALFGERFKDGAEARFRYTDVTYSHLPSLLGRPPFADIPATSEFVRAIGVKPVQTVGIVHDGTEIRFSVAPDEEWADHTATLRADGRFSLSSDLPLTLREWHRSFLGPIGYLVSLGIGRASTVEEQIVMRQSPWGTSLQAIRRAPYVTVARAKPLVGPSRDGRSRQLFTLADEGITMDQMLPRWLQASASLELPMNLYFGAMFAPFMYMETRFLSLVQAAEGYHRARFEQSVDDAGLHSDRLAAIYESIQNADNRAWLRRQLGDWSNEPRLRKRLADLFGLARDQGLSVTSREAKALVDEVKSARDDLSHGGLDSSRNRDVDLWRLERQLTTVMQACWLKELGLEKTVAGRILRDTH